MKTKFKVFETNQGRKVINCDMIIRADYDAEEKCVWLCVQGIGYPLRIDGVEDIRNFAYWLND